MTDSEHLRDPGVTPGLGKDSLASVNQDEREICGRGAGRHVAGVLLVSGRVGDDEAAAGGLEGAVRDIDGDALFAFVLQAVHEQGQVGGGALGAVAAGVLFHHPHLVRRHLAAVVENPPDERALAVVHAAAEDDAKDRWHQR